MEREILDKLEQYLRGQLSLEDLRSWLLEAVWDKPDAPEIAHKIEFVLDEASLGSLSRKQLDARLSAVANDAAVSVLSVRV